MLRILKDLINRLFGIKSKEINKPKLKLIVDNGDKNKEIYLGKYLTLEETKISDENFEKLKDHFKESIKKKVHPWDFEKNLDNQLKGTDLTYFLYLYYIRYLDYHDHCSLSSFNEFFFENDLDEMIMRNDKKNKESLRILKYHTLGFILINGSKEEVERKKEFEKIADNDWVGTESDNLALLFKVWDKYQKKFTK